MNAQQKKILLKLLGEFEEVWFENMCFATMFGAIEDGDPEKCVAQAVNWKPNLDKMKSSPARELHRAQFQPLIDAIDRSIESQDILDILAKIVVDRGRKVH